MRHAPRWRSSLAAALGGALLTLASPACADPDDSLRSTVDRIVGSAAQAKAIPGVIVGVSWPGQRRYFAYSGTGDPLPTADSIVEIASITKVFTTALFAEALSEGRMRADAPIQSYLGVQLMPCAGQVTPLELADFTSGMPTLPPNVPRELRDRGIEHYTRADFFAWVARWAPGDGFSCNLPDAYRYSNASIGLLGYIVAERLGAPWADLIKERITAPLHMTSTMMRVPDAERGRVVLGHLLDGGPAIPWPVYAWFAAGALRSTASDMLSFGEAALGHETVEGRPVPQALREALRDAMRPIYQPEDQRFLQGMAWQDEPGDPDEGTRPVFLKAGGSDGFNSVIVVNPGKDLTIFIAANKAVNFIPQIGVKLSRFIH